MNRSIIIAVTIAAVISLWLLSGFIRDVSTEVPPSISINEQNEGNVSRLTVRVVSSQAQPQRKVLKFSGRTEASRTVHVLAETGSQIVALPNDKGSEVKKGDILCRLAVEDRAARMAEAEATMKLRELEYEAAQSLYEKGHRSDTAVAAAKAQYDGAIALVKRMKVELDNIYIRAPFDGVVEDLPTEVGGYLTPGAPCAVLVDEDPFLVVAHLSEKEIGGVVQGAKASIKLVSGETLEGTIRFVAKTAQQVTRTFRIEVEVPNPDHNLRAGVTANMAFRSTASPAHFVNAAALTMNEQGQIGVKTVNDKGEVKFIATTILHEENNGVWLDGLPASATIITVGQEYVVDGEFVNTEADEQLTPSGDTV